MEEQKEYKTLYHIVYLIISTLMSILLATVATLLNWGEWIVYVIAAMIVFSWYLHISRVVSNQTRMAIYTLEVAGLMLYYGSDPVSVADLPLVVIIFIFLSAINNAKTPVLILALIFPVELAYLIITGRFEAKPDTTMAMRLVLGALSIFSATAIALFHQKFQQVERDSRLNLEKQAITAREDNKIFMENISHELRTPINAVNGMSQVILKKDLDEELFNSMDSIYKAGRRLSDDISNILDYSEILTNKLQLSENDYEIMSVVNDISTGFIWYDEYDQLELAIDVKQDVPAILHGDEGKIRRILTLLLDYSMKDTTKGGLYLGVSSSPHDYGCNLNIDILNVGKSLTKDEIADIYASFNTSKNMVKGKNGLELGLVVVHGIVAKMGGFIKIDSPDNATSRIHVSFPQKVVSPRPTLVLKDAEKYKVACYFNQDKYVYPQINEIYKRIIENFKSIVGIEIYVADSLSRLKNIISSRSITHIFVAEWEYKMDPKYFETLSETYHTSIFAGKSFQLPNHSNINIFRKPIYTLSILNNLQALTPGQKDFQHSNEFENAQFNGMKALVVDDDALNLRVAREILQQLGMNVQTASSGEDAIERCNFEEFDIIFMDYMMRGMNGIECMKKIHEIRSARYKAIPIIALTANAVSGARHMFLSEGFDEFISKPIEVSRMARVIKKFYREA